MGLTLALLVLLVGLSGLVAGGTGKQLVSKAGLVLSRVGVVPGLVVRSLLGVAWRSQDVSSCLGSLDCLAKHAPRSLGGICQQRTAEPTHCDRFI